MPELGPATTDTTSSSDGGQNWLVIGCAKRESEFL